MALTPPRAATAMYYRLLCLTGRARRARRQPAGGIVLCYHNVVTTPPAVGDHGVHLALGEFERQLAWLARHCAVVPLTHFVGSPARVGRTRLPVAITLDDAYHGAMTHAWPALRRAGLPATMFVATGFIGRDIGFWWDHPAMQSRMRGAQRDWWLVQARGDQDAIARAVYGGAPFRPPPDLRPATWDTLRRAAADGLQLGVHSTTHRTLPTLDDRELERELVRSRTELERHTGVRASSFSYPYGWHDARVRDAVRRAGYACAVTLDYGDVAYSPDVWRLRRINVPASLSLAAFEAWVSGLAWRAGTSS